MSNFRRSVPAPSQGAGAPRPKNALVTIVHAADILVFPPSDVNGVLMIGNIVLKQGATMHRVYETDDSQKASHSIEGDADAEGFMKKFEGSHPGDSLEISEFVQNTIGQGVIIIYPTDCGSNSKKVIGTPCNPLYLKGEFMDDKDGVKHTLQFEQRRRDRFVSKFYDGTLSFGENYQSADFNLSIEPQYGYVYELPASTVASTDIEFGGFYIAHKEIFSLVGNGGTQPATLANGVVGGVTVVLSNGTTWTALKDSVITLQYFFAGSTIYVIEVSRT
jgi:hypothetical protein